VCQNHAKQLYRWNFFKRSNYLLKNKEESNSMDDAYHQNEQQRNRMMLVYEHPQFRKGDFDNVRKIKCRKRIQKKKREEMAMDADKEKKRKQDYQQRPHEQVVKEEQQEGKLCQDSKNDGFDERYRVQAPDESHGHDDSYVLEVHCDDSASSLKQFNVGSSSYTFTEQKNNIKYRNISKEGGGGKGQKSSWMCRAGLTCAPSPCLLVSP
jgi:hypothetical protein